MTALHVLNTSCDPPTPFPRFQLLSKTVFSETHLHSGLGTDGNLCDDGGVGGDDVWGGYACELAMHVLLAK